MEKNGSKTRITGGTATYGQIAGILMMDSTIPRIPGDPGHAATFDFPVRYGVVRGFPFDDLVHNRSDHIDLIIQAALELQREGVRFIAADCGLFSIFQKPIAAALAVPFIGSSLNLIPLIAGCLPASRKIGLITGHSGLLNDAHLTAAGADPDRLVIAGMEHCREFQNVVIDRGPILDPEAMRQGVLSAAEALASSGTPLGAVVLECTNLISFKADLQQRLRLPVFDLVNLIELFAKAFEITRFRSKYFY